MRGKPFALTFAGPRGGSETGDVMSVMKLNQEAGRSFSGVLLFWWILFVVLQKAERLFLLVQASFQETAATDVLVKTLMTGLRGDLIVASLAIGPDKVPGTFSGPCRVRHVRGAKPKTQNVGGG